MTTNFNPGVNQPWSSLPTTSQQPASSDKRKKDRQIERGIQLQRADAQSGGTRPLMVHLNDLHLQYFWEVFEKLVSYLKQEGVFISTDPTNHYQEQLDVLYQQPRFQQSICFQRQMIRAVCHNDAKIEYLHICVLDDHAESMEELKRIKKDVYEKNDLLSFWSHDIDRRPIPYSAFLSYLKRDDSDCIETLTIKSHDIDERRLWTEWGLPPYSLKGFRGNLFLEADAAIVHNLHQETTVSNDVCAFIPLQKPLYGAHKCFFLVYGAPITWTIARPNHKMHIEDFVSAKLNVRGRCNAWVSHQNIHIPPEDFGLENIEVVVFDQQPGSIVWIHGESYHQGYSTGPNIFTSIAYAGYTQDPKITQIKDDLPCKIQLGCDHESTFSELQLERPNMKRGKKHGFYINEDF